MATARILEVAPSSSVQAMARVERADLRALKTSLDDLDDADITAVARAVLVRTPARARKNVAVVVGVVASFGLFAVSPVGAAALMLGIGCYQLVTARRDIESDLEDIGLSPQLAASLAAACTLRTTQPRFRLIRKGSSIGTIVKEQLFGSDDRLQEVGQCVVDEARRRERG